MLMPTVFHENLFDDFFDPFWNDAALERMMNREARDTFGKRGGNMMKTDVKQTDNGYEVAVDPAGLQEGRRSDGSERRLPDHSGSAVLHYGIQTLWR